MMPFAAVPESVIDPTRTFDAHIHCAMCYLRLRRRLSLLLFAAIRGINVPVFKGRRFGEEADGLRLSGCYSFSLHDPSWCSALCGRSWSSRIRGDAAYFQCGSVGASSLTFAIKHKSCTLVQFCFWHIASSRCAAEFSRYRGIAESADPWRTSRR